MSSNDFKCVHQVDLKGNIDHFDTTTLRQENALERLENENQTLANDRMSETQVHHTTQRYSLLTEDSDTEIIEIDTRNCFPLCQGYIHEEIPDLLVKCYDSSNESPELKRKNLQEESVTLSAVGRCIRTACDTLLGMDYCDTDHVLKTTDSPFMGTISSNSIHLASFMEPDKMDSNVKKKSESKCENLRSENNVCKQDSSLSPSKHAREKVFQCEVCQRFFSRKETLNKHMRTHTGEKPFQCQVCQRTFSRKQLVNRHMLTHSGKKDF
ncbi:hypothetical protein NPIL_341931 [Nephila pilipes]|uniref:C2H2-type domain-containing protein n=1 Tax=Nephila pilipes TaxID=299642 RepID=A0A8X6UL78_NEPPI|nr:hypothetical protein NPIL_341931 [Nephila pilipes]